MDQVQELMETSCGNRRVGWPWLLAKGHIHHSQGQRARSGSCNINFG